MRRQVYVMKHKQQMSLIARRAQIRRAAAGRKGELPNLSTAQPMLRLVAAAGCDAERGQQDTFRERAVAAE